MITNLVILAFTIGLLTIPVIIGAIFWARDLQLRMTWWKWTLAAIWYFLLLFFILVDFTFIGEGEAVAGWRGLAFQLVFMIILGAGLVRILFAGRKKV